MNVTVIDRRTGQRKTMAARYAKILHQLGKAVIEGQTLEQMCEELGLDTSRTQADPAPGPKRRGRPPKAKSAE